MDPQTAITALGMVIAKQEVELSQLRARLAQTEQQVRDLEAASTMPAGVPDAAA
jgi:cell division protein FtsB